MSKYVVTGGAGFIGSALVRGLLREGASRVVVIDNLLTGREENLDEVRSSVEYHRADVRDDDGIAPILRGGSALKKDFSPTATTKGTELGAVWSAFHPPSFGKAR